MSFFSVPVRDVQVGDRIVLSDGVSSLRVTSLRTVGDVIDVYTTLFTRRQGGRPVPLYYAASDLVLIERTEEAA